MKQRDGPEFAPMALETMPEGNEKQHHRDHILAQLDLTLFASALSRKTRKSAPQMRLDPHQLADNDLGHITSPARHISPSSRRQIQCLKRDRPHWQKLTSSSQQLHHHRSREMFLNDPWPRAAHYSQNREILRSRQFEDHPSFRQAVFCLILRSFSLPFLLPNPKLVLEQLALGALTTIHREPALPRHERQCRRSADGTAVPVPKEMTSNKTL